MHGIGFLAFFVAAADGGPVPAQVLPEGVSVESLRQMQADAACAEKVLPLRGKNLTQIMSEDILWDEERQAAYSACLKERGAPQSAQPYNFGGRETVSADSGLTRAEREQAFAKILSDLENTNLPAGVKESLIRGTGVPGEPLAGAAMPEQKPVVSPAESSASPQEDGPKPYLFKSPAGRTSPEKQSKELPTLWNKR